MQHVSISKDEINRPFERFFINFFVTISLLLFIWPEDVERGKLSFTALLILFVYVPATLWIYLSIFKAQRLELVTKLEKRFMIINIVVVILIGLLIYLLDHSTYVLLGNWTYRILGILAFIGFIFIMIKRLPGALPLAVIGALSLLSWNFAGESGILIWFIIIFVTMLVLIREFSVIYRFNKDLKGSGVLK